MSKRQFDGVVHFWHTLQNCATPRGRQHVNLQGAVPLP
jgi:hypothetical protein